MSSHVNQGKKSHSDFVFQFYVVIIASAWIRSEDDI